MKITRLKLNNFLSYKEQEFSDFDGPALILIEGHNKDQGDSNGSGKSSVFDGISWALFGQTLRDSKTDNVINRDAKKAGCSVELDVEVQGKVFQIVRFYGHPSEKNNLYLKEDGTDVTLGTTTLTQKFLKKAIGIDFDLFRCTVVFAQGETFKFIDETDKKQKEILSKIMRIDFGPLLDKSKKEVSGLESKRSDVERVIVSLDAKLEINPEETYKDEVEKWEKEHQESISRAERIVSEAQDRLDGEGSLKVDVEALKVTREKIVDRISAIEKSIDEMQDMRTNNLADQRSFDSELNRFNKLVADGKCPTCLQAVEAHDLKSEIDTLKIKRHVATDAAQKAEKVIVECRNSKTEFEAKKDKIDTVIAETEAHKKRLANLADVLEQGKNALNTIKTEVNPWADRIKREMEEYEKTKFKRQEAEKKVAEIDEKLRYARFWVTGFGDSGMKSFIFDLVCSSLTSKANRYVGIMTDGMVSIVFTTQTKLKSGEVRERFSCDIITNGERIPYESYSGGEKTRISLAVDLALSDVMSDYYGSQFNVAVFDEQDLYMDNKGRTSYMNLLKEVAQRKRVFVVAHDDVFKGAFSDSWIIEKEGGFSKRVA